MGCRTPFVGGGGKNVEAAWMREVKFLFLDFPRSLVSGRSSVRVEQADDQFLIAINQTPKEVKPSTITCL